MKTEKVSNALGAVLVGGYAFAHILAAVMLFKSVKLWAFLVMLFVPGLGDVMAISMLLKLRHYLPLIIYGAVAVFWFAVYVVASATESRRRRSK